MSEVDFDAAEHGAAPNTSDRSRPIRPSPRMALGLAGVAAIVLIAVIVASLGSVNVGPNDDGTFLSPSPTGGQAPSQTTQAGHILTLAELRAAIDGVRSNGAPLAVVADVTVNQDVAFAGPICLADTPCSRPLGVIDGLDGVVVWLTGDDPYPELTKSDLSRPLALRIQSGSGVTLLGHAVAPRVDSLIWGVAAASGQVASTPLGGVLAVEGWLTTFSSTCGPAPQPGPPIAPPFNCAIADVIAPEPGEAPHVAGWTSGPTALRVQKGAYNEFASNPDRIGPEPWRFGVYLVEHVANRNANCRGCDAWLLVGRLGG